MNSQIFKNQISKEMLFDLLEKICIKNDKYYTLNKISFKKCEFLNLWEPFCKEISSAYHKSKQFYLKREMTYKNTLTIIRQILNRPPIHTIHLINIMVTYLYKITENY